MHLRITQKQRGSSALLSCSFMTASTTDQACEECIIDNLVGVRIKVKGGGNNGFNIYMSHLKMTEEKVQIIVSVSCENPSFNKKWICTEEWSEREKLCVINVDNCMSIGTTQMYTLQIYISVRKIEKPELCAAMYLDADFTDFSLSAVNGSVAVHKIVMASHSDVFRAMLNGEWKETAEGKIEVKGTTRECLEHLKDYMYLDILPDEGLCPLLLLALRYMIGNLKTRCIGKLTDALTSENLYELLDFACANNIPELTYEILHSTPSEIVNEAYESKKTHQLNLSESTSSDTNDK